MQAASRERSTAPRAPTWQRVPCAVGAVHSGRGVGVVVEAWSDDDDCSSLPASFPTVCCPSPWKEWGNYLTLLEA